MFTDIPGYYVLVFLWALTYFNYNFGPNVTTDESTPCRSEAFKKWENCEKLTSKIDVCEKTQNIKS